MRIQGSSGQGVTAISQATPEGRKGPVVQEGMSHKDEVAAVKAWIDDVVKDERDLCVVVDNGLRGLNGAKLAIWPERGEWSMFTDAQIDIAAQVNKLLDESGTQVAWLKERLSSWPESSRPFVAVRTPTGKMTLMKIVGVSGESITLQLRRTSADAQTGDQNEATKADLSLERTSSRSVLSVAPKEPFSPQSEAELLSELNAQLSFDIQRKDFIAKEKSGTLVGWAVVGTGDQKEIVKTRLKECETLRLLQVEGLTPEFETIMKQHER